MPWLLLALLMVTSCRLCAQGIPRNPPIPENLGVNIHFTDPQPGEMKELAAGGFRWVRMDLNWAGTETVKGQYNFSDYDRLFASLAPYNIWPILILDYTNRFYDRGLSPYDEAGRDAFANWVAAAVEHFRGRGAVWEMYNEPNWTFWSPKPNVADYIKLALKVGETIEETAPGETYIGPAGALIDMKFLKACFQAGLLNYWSAVSVHPYRQMKPETVIDAYGQLRKMIAADAPAGKRIPIIAGEWGYPSARSWMNLDEHGQGVMFAREMLTDIAEGVPVTIWYDWRDDGADPKVAGLHCGVVHNPYKAGGDPVYSPKPAYIAAQTLARFFAGAAFRKRIAVGGPDNFALLFTRGPDARLAVWTDGAGPRSVTIAGARGKFAVTSFLGAKLRPLRARRNALTIVLSNEPQYLAPEKVGGLARVADLAR
ncbi:MAG: beta-1,4-xylanase [Terriglobia bacterium]